MVGSILYRQAKADDDGDVAHIFRTATRQALPYLPELHTDEEDIAHFSEIVAKQHVVLAEISSEAVGFCAFTSGWLNYLYILPEYHGRGIGTHLLNTAMQTNDELQLWTFQRNQAARRFYERHGFVAVEFTSGQHLEEKEPDVRYVWQGEKA